MLAPQLSREIREPGKRKGGRSSRNKGQRGEREFLAALGSELGEALTRNLDQTRKGGADCICVRGWAIEVKFTQRSAWPSWWAQAVKQANTIGAMPMLAHRKAAQPGQPKPAWRVWAAWPGPTIREMTIAEAAGAIRERWCEMGAEVPGVVVTVEAIT